ncbi:unnamed protein product [Clonostachys rosea f. rosea IK726]|uniref:Uncharacterized protein n=2 Tax=Bionectria ochroleuca TaxID=29856 RepID=A0A0B7JQZ2_BIOOC|nr:unnamed protein product [Clonostachys rosea f. rosea IK726]
MSTTTSCGAMPRHGSASHILYLFVFAGLTSHVYALPSGSSRVVLSERTTAELQADGFTLIPRAESEGTLSKGAAAGIVVGVIVAGSIVLSAVWFWLRRKKSSPETETHVVQENERGLEPVHENDTDSEKLSTTSLTDATITTPPSRSGLSRIMSKVAPARVSSQPKNQSIDKTVPIEAPDNEVFELAACRPPAELDADTGGSDDFWIVDHEVGFGLDEAYPLSPYEQTRLKMDRQLAGPVPAYTPGDWAQIALEKKGQDDAKDGYEGEQQESFPNRNSPEMRRSSSNACVDPSPLSSHNTWSTHISQVVSPMTMVTSVVTPKFPPTALTRGNSSGTYRERSLELNLTTRSNSVPNSSSSERGSSRVQRTPINPTEVVCLGPIPENIMLPGQSPRPEMDGPEGFNLVLPTFQPSDDPAEDTLGSNFTIEEEARIAEVLETVRTATQAELSQKLQSRWSSANKGTSIQASQQSPPLPAMVAESESASPTTMEEEPIRKDRIDPALDLIHVPQIPNQRYSWEGSTPH